MRQCFKCKNEIEDENKIFVINRTGYYKDNNDWDNIYQCPYCGEYQVREE